MALPFRVKRQLILGYALHPEMRDLSGVAELVGTFLPEGHSHIRTTGGEAEPEGSHDSNGELRS